MLAALADQHLRPRQVRGRGLFDPGEVALLTRRAPGALYPEDQLYRLWTLLLTEIWSGIYLDRRGAAPLTAGAALARAA